MDNFSGTFLITSTRNGMYGAFCSTALKAGR